MVMTIGQLEKISITALNRAYKIHQELGAKGEELVEKNQFGDTALRVDIEAEKAVINTLKEAEVPIRIISEEHGITNIGGNPIYLGILDGLDGSDVYKKERGKGRYGTMLGIFSNLDPEYNDYIFSGVMEHSKNKLFYATKGNGSFVIENDKKTPIKCSNCKTLDKRTRIYIDEYWDINKKTFSEKLKGFNTTYLGSSAVYYVDLASGKTDLVLECTRKGNLEIAVAYGLEIESGGVVVTSDGLSLGQKKYLEFGQDRYIPVISASTKQMAKELIKHIGKNQT